MIAVLRSEWIKLRTIRMNWVLIAIAVAFPLVVCILTTSLQKERDINANDVVGLVSGTSTVTALLLGVIAATAITGEFGFGTIRPTFAATPQRSKVITAKAIVSLVLGLAAEAVVVVLAYAACSIIASNRDRPISLSDVPAGTAPLLGVTVFAGIVSLLGYGLGLIIRNTPATVAVLLVWPLVIEGLIAALLGAIGVDHPAKFLPYNSGIQLGNPDSGTSADVLSRLPAGLYFGSVTLVILVIGTLLTARRDA
jgi:ABC-2 type transport system permease protein